MLILMGVYVDIVTGEELGYKIGGSSVYSAAVTYDKAVELKVQDIDIVNYLGLDIIEVVGGKPNTYAMLSNEVLFMPELEEIPYEKLEGRVSLWGHIFNENAICSFDNQTAIDRVIAMENDK